MPSSSITSIMAILLVQLSFADGAPILSERTSNVDQGHSDLLFVKPIAIGIILFLCAFLAFHLYAHWKPVSRSPPQALYFMRNPPIARRRSRRSGWFSPYTTSSPRGSFVSSDAAVLAVRDVPRMPGKALFTKLTAPTVGPRGSMRITPSPRPTA